MLEALKIAGEIDDDNSTRQGIERKITEEACLKIEQNGYHHNRVIVVEGENWHSGIVGIVASRICEKYGKPAIVLSVSDEISHGSGRSLSGFHLYNALCACDRDLQKFGGHELAAGISLNTCNIEAFRQSINKFAANMPAVVPTLNIDFRLNPAGLSVDMVEVIKTLEPFGNGNPAPVFGLFGVTLDRITAVGNGKHLRLLFSKGGGAFQAMLFGVTPEQLCFDVGDVLDLAVSLDANLFREEYSLTIRIRAMRKSGVDEERLFEEIFAFDDFMSGISLNSEILLPNRAQAGEVYKYLSRGAATEEKLKYAFLGSIGYAKTQIALKTLCELGLLTSSGGYYHAVKTAEKTDLLNSQTYKTISGGGDAQ